MGKKKSGQEQAAVNKTQLVRDYLTSQPDAMPKTVSAALKQQGVEVSPQIVSQIKYQLRLLGGRSNSKLLAATGNRSRKSASSLSAADLLKVKELVDELGGEEKIQAALEILKRLA